MAAGARELRRSLASYDWIGFDLDHCLARYNQARCYPLIYGAIRSFMVEQKGYRELADPPWAELEPLCQKGLVLEWATGNVLRISATGRVAAARHGRRLLSDAELHAAYGKCRSWQHFDDLRCRRRSRAFTAFCTYFDIPVVPLYMLLIEAADEKAVAADTLCPEAVAHTDTASVPASASMRQGAVPGAETKRDAGTLAARYAQIPVDLFEGFNYTYNADALGEGRGGFFPALKADIGSYVHARPWLRRWLGKLRSGAAQDGGVGQRGPRVFLATNSHADFADLLLRRTFGEDWATAMADVLVVNCQKPAWFHHTPSTADATADGAGPQPAPFRLLGHIGRRAGAETEDDRGKVLISGDDAGRILRPGAPATVAALRTPCVPSATAGAGTAADAAVAAVGAGADAGEAAQGHAVLARGSFAALVDAGLVPGSKVAYFGDSFSSDIVPARDAGCDAVLVLEELADDQALDGGVESAAAVRAAGFSVPLGRGGFGGDVGGGSDVARGDPCEAVDTAFLRKSAWGSWFTCSNGDGDGDGDGDGQGDVELHHWAAVAQELSTAVISSVEDLNVELDELDE